MAVIKRSHLIGSTIIICVVVFIVPFVIKSKSDTYISVFSLSFTALGTVATFATLVIAILLYDRFGLKGLFIERQTDKVLELARHLKNINLNAQAKTFTYIVHINFNTLKMFEGFPPYKEDQTKTILLSFEDYELFMKEIYEFKNSYWLPEKIKQKLKFLEIFGMKEVEDFNDGNYIKFSFGYSSENDTKITIPKLTFEMLNINFHALINEIDEWIKKHSEIPIDLKF